MYEPDAQSYAAGTKLLYQEIWAERLLAARSVTVAVDEHGLLVLYSHPGATYRTAALGVERAGMPLHERVTAMVSDEDRTFVERRASDKHVLLLVPRDRWHAVWLFWNEDRAHLSWHVSLQQPIRRFGTRVEVRDCALDLVVRLDRSWAWKDRDEFDALCACGFFDAAVAARVEAEAKAMVGIIERWGSPFCDGWERWRPPAWPCPALPNDWSVRT